MNQPAKAILQEEPARFTVEQFTALAGAIDALDVPGRVELIDGVITRIPPAHLPHVRLVNDLTFEIRTILKAVGSGLMVYSDPGLVLNPDTVRQPDILVFRAETSATYLNAQTVVLAIEVADTTLALDLGPRKTRFAEAGVPNYWVIDIEGQRVHLFAEPGNGEYRQRTEQSFEAELVLPDALGSLRLA